MKQNFRNINGATVWMRFTE